MVDTLTISSIELWTHLGVPESERATEQRVLVTIIMNVDASKTGKTDDVHDTINYQAVVSDIRSLAIVARKTIERLAEDIAEMILRNYKPAIVTVCVTKYVLPGTKDICLSITRP